jgi:hypothetical protein
VNLSTLLAFAAALLVADLLGSMIASAWRDRADRRRRAREEEHLLELYALQLGIERAKGETAPDLRRRCRDRLRRPTGVTVEDLERLEAIAASVPGITSAAVSMPATGRVRVQVRASDPIAIGQVRDALQRSVAAGVDWEISGQWEAV